MEVRRGGRAKVQLQPSTRCLHILFDQICLLARGTIHDEKDTPATSFAEVLEELHEAARSEPAGGDLAPEPAPGTHRADRADRLSLPGRRDYRSATLQPIGFAKGGRGGKSGLVEEKDRGSKPAGSPAQLRIILNPAMEIAAEDADYAENADEEGLRSSAVRSIAFTLWVRNYL